ncbi:MAG: elongation factor G [Bacteroidales bacterium]|nr:elongation factor G [Bacteroidales bacterium]
MKEFQTNEIRNVALIGAAKSGKTTLAENMLFEGKIINRKGSTDEKNTVSDYRQIEMDRQISVNASMMYTIFNNKKINILDTPGFSDFSGDIVSCLSAVDTAVCTINAQSGVEATTENAWRHAAATKKPVVFFMNQLDHANANFDNTIREMKEYFGDKVTPIQYPVNAGEDFNAIIDLIMMKMLVFKNGNGAPEIQDIPAAEMDKAEELHNNLVEHAAEGDEALMEKFFEEMTLSEEDMEKGIHLGILNREMFPVLCGAAKKGVGVTRLCEFLINACPSPADTPAVKAMNGTEFHNSNDDPAALFIFKVTTEQNLGDVAWMRVYGGQVAEGQDFVNPRSGNKERISQLLAFEGKNRERVEKVNAGDIIATIKLKDGRIGDSLVDAKVAEAAFEAIPFPEPIFQTAIKAVNSQEDEKLGGILNDLHKTDPTIIAGMSRELRQNILQCQGEYHLNTLKWYFDNVYKIGVEFSTPKVPYRETITKSAKADYRHKKQSGGSGQFGEVHMMLAPYFEGYTDPEEFAVRSKDEYELPWGGKLIFANCVVGGAIDARFMPAILKGINERLEQGPLTGSYARDIIAYIYDGKMHPVDSNEMAFKIAGRMAFSAAFKNAGPKIMEPIYDLVVRVPADLMGAVMTDLTGRRGIVMGMDSDHNYQVIRARVPFAEMDRYSTTLSSLTSGRGTFTMKYAEYAQVPADVQQRLLKEYEESQKEEE